MNNSRQERNISIVKTMKARRMESKGYCKRESATLSRIPYNDRRESRLNTLQRTQGVERDKIAWLPTVYRMCYIQNSVHNL